MNRLPVDQPVFGHLYVTQQLQQDNHKPTAAGTRFRFSDATKCPRALVWKARGVPESNPMDAPGIHVTSLGSAYHLLLQEAIMAKYPDAEVEVVSDLGVTSGACDFVVPEHPDLGRVVGEIKTINGFGYAKAVGVSKVKYGAAEAEGPRESAIVQGALHALAQQADTLVIVYVAMEAVSKNLAEKANLDDLGRIISEWHYDRDYWEPLAQAELKRIRDLDRIVDDTGVLPAGAYFMGGKWKATSPITPRHHWTCDYCPFVDRCAAVERGRVA